MQSFSETLFGFFILWILMILVSIGALALSVWTVVKVLQMTGVL